MKIWTIPRKKAQIALLNKTDFKVKFKFKVEICVLQISVDHKFGSNICNILEGSTRPFYFFHLETFLLALKLMDKLDNVHMKLMIDSGCTTVNI